MNLFKLYEDQRAFNRLIFNGKGEQEIIGRLKELTFGIVEEALEFIRTYDFKVHRRSKLRLQNVAHSHEELIDIFKYWLSLADASDFPMDRLEELYFAKSRVVQYRFQEEWMKTIDRPCVVVDIDQVLADYISGVCRWVKAHAPVFLKLHPSETIRLAVQLDRLEQTGGWVDALSVGMSHIDWQRIKHEFRTRGGKRYLPVFDDARPFLKWCRSQGWIIILVTSRPIDTYPNIFTDTLSWLTENELPFDHLWWTTDKSERLDEANLTLQSQIVFAVDDQLKYVNQFASRKIKTYWLDRSRQYTAAGGLGLDITVVDSLTGLMEKEKEMSHVI